MNSARYGGSEPIGGEEVDEIIGGEVELADDCEPIIGDACMILLAIEVKIDPFVVDGGDVSHDFFAGELNLNGDSGIFPRGRLGDGRMIGLG